MRRGRRLLNVEPQEITFLFELRRRASCTIRLSNNSREHVAFKVTTTSPEKYFGQPSIEILSPGSSCDVTVTMVGPVEAPFDMQCRDKFYIKSLIASPRDTAERVRNLFNERWRVVEVYRLRVVYIQRSSNSQLLDRNRRHTGVLFVKGITFVLLCFIFGYLIMKMLQFIWTLIFVMTMFLIKMITKQVSDSVEEWIQRALLYLCIQFLPVAFETLLYRCFDFLLSVYETIHDICIHFLSAVFQQR